MLLGGEIATTRWFPGLLPRLAELAKSEGLIFDGDSSLPNVQPLPKIEGEFADLVAKVVAALEATVPGQTYRLVTHPMFDDEQTRPMTYGTRPPGAIVRERDWDPASSPTRASGKSASARTSSPSGTTKSADYLALFFA